MKKMILLLAALFAQSVLAETVTLTLNNGLVANANFRSNATTKPAIIIVHGFLSTYNYSTIRIISDALYDHGYTVLSPNLTLGITNRTEPLPCNTLHQNNLQTEGNEINAWLSWLKNKGYQHLILIGHSSGSNSILASLEKNNTPLDKIILTSLYDFSVLPEKLLERDKKRAQNSQETNKPDKYSLGLCRGNYLTTSSNYLSYINWSKTRIIDSINRSIYPITVIMPGQDSRLKDNETWLTQLKQTKTNLIVIPQADHFFSSDAEFDLADTIQQSIKAN